MFARRFKAHYGLSATTYRKRFATRSALLHHPAAPVPAASWPPGGSAAGCQVLPSAILVPCPGIWPTKAEDTTEAIQRLAVQGRQRLAGPLRGL